MGSRIGDVLRDGRAAPKTAGSRAGRDYDVHKLFERMRQRTEKLKAEGRQVVCPEPRQPEAASALHEETPWKNGSPSEKRP
jgi:hypothetical protein